MAEMQIERTQQTSAPAPPHRVVSNHHAAEGNRDASETIGEPRKSAVAKAIAMLGGEDEAGASEVADATSAEAAAEAVAAETTAAEVAAPATEAASSEKTIAELRREKLTAQLERMQRRNADRRASSRVTDQETQVKTRAQQIEEREKVIAAREAALREDPVKFISELGKDPAEVFASLAEAAKTATTPEAKIIALEKLAEAKSAAIEAKLQALEEREVERERQAQRAHVVREFLSVAAEKCKTAVMVGMDNDRLVTYADQVADRRAADGKSTDYASVAAEIESEAQQIVAQMLDRVDLDTLDKHIAKRRPAQTQTPQTPTASGATQAPAKAATKTITNDLASTSASQSARKRESLAERQRKALAMLK